MLHNDDRGKYGRSDRVTYETKLGACRYKLEHITSSFIHQSINIFNLRLDQSMNVMQCTVGWFGKDVAIIDMSLRFVPLDDK